MRTSQQVFTGNSSRRITPAQRRLSAALTDPGMRMPARRSAMQPARKAEYAAAITGGVLILGFIIGLLAM